VVGERAAVDGSREGAMRLAPLRGSFSRRDLLFFNLDLPMKIGVLVLLRLDLGVRVRVVSVLTELGLRFRKTLPSTCW